MKIYYRSGIKPLKMVAPICESGFLGTFILKLTFLRDTMKRVLDLPPNCVIEYKAHKAAVADNSSFRNTETYR